MAGNPPNFLSDTWKGDSGGPLLAPNTTDPSRDMQARVARASWPALQLPGCGRASQSCHLPSYVHRHPRCFDGTGQSERHNPLLPPPLHMPPAGCPPSCAMQFGIVSNGMYGQPGYYTDVSLFSSWIARGQQVGGRGAEQAIAQPGAHGSFAPQGCASSPNSPQQFPTHCYPDSSPTAAVGAKRAGG